MKHDVKSSGTKPPYLALLVAAQQSLLLGMCWSQLKSASVRFGFCISSPSDANSDLSHGHTITASSVQVTTTVLRPLIWDHPGEPVPEENFLPLWCKERLTEAETPTIRLGATPSALTSTHLHHPPFFYRSDALPVRTPTHP